MRISRQVMTVIYAMAAMSLATNIALLRDGSESRAGHARLTRAELTAVELGRGRIGTRAHRLRSA